MAHFQHNPTQRDGRRWLLPLLVGWIAALVVGMGAAFLIWSAVISWTSSMQVPGRIAHPIGSAPTTGEADHGRPATMPRAGAMQDGRG